MSPAIGPGLVTLGETMVLLSQREVGRLRHATSLSVGIGGAESNVAIGVARLGTPATWVGRVGADELGELVVSRIRGEGVRVFADYDSEVPTALMVKERRTAALTRVHYYRAGGPGSRFRPEDLPDEAFTGAGVLHLSGITSALGPSAHQTVLAAVARARALGMTVSLDINYRAALWSPAEAGETLRDLAGAADVLFAGDDEAQMLGAAGTPDQLAEQLSALGARQVVVKLGARGAVALVDGRRLVAEPLPVEAVDSVGAGDAFVAGYLSELLAGAAPEDRLATAAACGAFAVTSPGDWEGLPTRADLALLDVEPGSVHR
jgi:2-dehydro-3-deoxygluconokinase